MNTFTLRILGLYVVLAGAGTSVLAGACTSTPADPLTAAAASIASCPSCAPALELGQVHRYDLDWTTAATRTLGPRGLSGAMTMRGQLAVAAIARDPDGTRVSAWFPRLATHELTVQGQPVVIDPAALIGLHAEFIVTPDGDVRRAFFAADSPPIFRELMLGVIARLDLRGASAGAATRTLRGGHGLIQATYRRAPDGALIRQLADVLRFDTAPGAHVDPRALTADARIELDDQRMPIRIELHDSAALHEPLELLTDDRFSLVRTAVEPGSVVALVGPREYDPTAGPDLHAADLELDRQYAAGYSLEDLGFAMDTMDAGILPRTGEISRAAASLRVWPERTTQLVTVARQSRGRGRQLAFDALSAAGTADAQAAMCALLRDAQAEAWPERSLLIQRFAFVAAPTPESGEFLLTLLADAERSDDAKLRQAALYPLGTVTGRVSDPLLAERMHAVLLTHALHHDPLLRAAAVAGLGNARRPEDLPRLLAALDDPQPGVRVEAAAALRVYHTPSATDALLTAIADDDPAVASRALTVLRKRHFEGRADPALVERARLGQYNEQLHRAIASTLLGSRDQPEVHAALLALAQRSPDRQLGLDLGFPARPADPDEPPTSP